MPKYHWAALLLERIPGPRALALFRVAVGAAVKVAFTAAPTLDSKMGWTKAAHGSARSVWCVSPGLQVFLRLKLRFKAVFHKLDFLRQGLAPCTPPWELCRVPLKKGGCAKAKRGQREHGQTILHGVSWFGPAVEKC